MVTDTWKEIEYDDSEWLSGTTSVGYGYENIIGMDLTFVRSFWLLPQKFSVSRSMVK